MYTDNGAYVINGEKADLIVNIISIIVGALTGIGLAALPAVIITDSAETILGAIVSTGATNIIGGKPTTPFNEEVAAKITSYKLKAYSPSTKVTKYFDGKKYIVTTRRSAHYNETFYSGYYPQFLSKKDVSVALWLFNDFYAHPFPALIGNLLCHINSSIVLLRYWN